MVEQRPVRRMRRRSGATVAVTDNRWHASHGVGEDLEVLYAAEPASHWFPAAPPVHSMTSSVAASLDGRPPLRWQTGSSFHASRPLQSAFAPSPAPAFRPGLHLPRVSPPSSRRHRKRPRCARVPLLAQFRPQVFATSRRFAPFPVCRLVSSYCHVQGSYCSTRGSSPGHQTADFQCMPHASPHGGNTSSPWRALNRGPSARPACAPRAAC